MILESMQEACRILPSAVVTVTGCMCVCVCVYVRVRCARLQQQATMNGREKQYAGGRADATAEFTESRTLLVTVSARRF